jgi:hypothetical protein
VMKIDEPAFDYLLEDNLSLNETLSEYILPNVNYATVLVDGYGESTSPLPLMRATRTEC